MNRLQAKKLVLGGLVVLLGMVLSGCFLAPPPVVDATLIFSDLVGPVGGQGEVKVSVAKMPDGGLAGLAVGSAPASVVGLTYDPTQFQVTKVEGLNGFQILATYIDNTAGEVRLVAINPTEGVVDGDVALIVGNRLGGTNFDFQVTNRQLGDANNHLITAYNVSLGKAPPYYVQGGEQ